MKLLSSVTSQDANKRSSEALCKETLSSLFDVILVCSPQPTVTMTSMTILIIKLNSNAPTAYRLRPIRFWLFWLLCLTLKWCPLVRLFRSMTPKWQCVSLLDPMSIWLLESPWLLDSPDTLGDCTAPPAQFLCICQPATQLTLQGCNLLLDIRLQIMLWLLPFQKRQGLTKACILSFQMLDQTLGMNPGMNFGSAEGVCKADSTQSNRCLAFPALGQSFGCLDAAIHQADCSIAETLSLPTRRCGCSCWVNLSLWFWNWNN